MSFSILILFAVITSTISAKGRTITTLPNCECGLANKGKDARIVDGEVVNMNEFPWVVGLYTNVVCSGKPVCGGALISDIHVLTAAHCVESGRIKCVTLGDHDVGSKWETNSISRSIMRLSLKWSIHHHYKKATEDIIPQHDIAMLQMTQPVNFTLFPNIRPLCLPDPFEDVTVGTKATVAGWGRIGKYNIPSRLLLKVDLPVIPNEQCQGMYQDFPGQVMPMHLCTYLDGKDSCRGDSGGALFALRPSHLSKDSKDRYEAIGVTSFGVGCAAKDRPGGCTRVNKYIKWIMRKMTDVSFNANVCKGFAGTWFS